VVVEAAAVAPASVSVVEVAEAEVVAVAAWVLDLAQSNTRDRRKAQRR